MRLDWIFLPRGKPCAQFYIRIKKCGVAVLKRGKLCKSEGIKVINGLTIREVDDEGYKYLGILELDKFKEKEMKGIFRTE